MTLATALPKRKTRRDSRQPEKSVLERLYVQEHLSGAAIAKRFGLSTGTMVHRWLRLYGIPARLPGVRSDQQRIWSKVQKSDGCWLWTGCVNGRGYGVATLNGRSEGAHRAVYLLLVGPVPDGLELDHLCRNRRCVNPTHLEPVTTRENVLRGTGPSARAARVTACPQGHPYDELNTARYRDGKRKCRACKRARRERDRERRLLGAPL